MAYFYINTDGSVVVRKSDDYIPTMIEIAGGRYVFKDLKNSEGNAPSVKLTMEEFYATAVDADYLIYNGTIDLSLIHIYLVKKGLRCHTNGSIVMMEKVGQIVKN